jgi:predicted HTH transcriptional regulator
VDSILLFLKKHAMRGADFSEVRRKDVWSIPLEILREVVINALVHADYSQRGAPIRVAFFDNRIEIENPGILLPGMTVEDMCQGVSKIRNHVIARIFRELNLIEQWGSGIPRILREAEKLGLPDLQMEEIGMRVRVTVHLAEQIKIKTPTPEVTGEVTGEVKRLLAVMTGEMKRIEIQSALGLKHEDYFREAYLIPAVKAGFIEMTILDKPRSPKQRYRITALGKEVLQKADQDK